MKHIFRFRLNALQTNEAILSNIYRKLPVGIDNRVLLIIFINNFIHFMKKSTVMLWAIFGALLMGCADEEIANVETSSRNAIGFNVLSNAA